MAAPVGGEVLKEVLDYLELQKDKVDEDEDVKEVTVPELRGLSLKEAKTKLKELNMELQVNTTESEIDEEKTIIKEQLPKPGIVINNTNKIYVDT